MSLAGAAAFGVSSLISGKTALEVKADGDPVTEIAMNADAFSNWTNDAGSFGSAGDTYWPDYAGYAGEDGDKPSCNYPFEAIGDFFRGETREGWTGTLTLKPWTQYTQYIYFQWGGANNAEAGEYLRFVCRNTSNDYIYNPTQQNDTFTDNKLLLRYFYIPDNEFEKLGGSNGFEMKIELVDERTGNFGFHNFGYLHVNQTKAQVGDAMRYYLNHMSQDLRPSQISRRKTIQGHYFTNGDLKDVFFADSADVSEDFESQDLFNKHWYFDHTYYNNNSDALHFDKSISTGTYRPGDSQMSFNKTDSGFFRGWYENESEGGFVNGDAPVYRFLSRPFVVDANNPFISIKMAGTASLHVIDATVNPGDNKAADRAWINNKAFNTGNIGERIYSGFNTCTMVRHVINLGAFAGNKIQLAICDYSNGGWGAAYFDELKVNYTPTSFKIDSIMQPTLNDGTFYSAIADKYINSAAINGETNPTGIEYVNGATPVLDTTEVKAAATYLANFYSSARVPGNHTTYCANLTSDDTKGFVNTFNALGDGVKTIVADSDDFDQYDEHIADWFRTPVEKFTVEETLNYIALRNGMDVENNGNLINSNFFGGNHMWNYIALTVIVSAAAVLAFFLIKRRKSKAE